MRRVRPTTRGGFLHGRLWSSLLGAFAVLLLEVPAPLQGAQGAPKGKEEIAEAEAEAEQLFDGILEQFEKEKKLQPYERMPTVEKFGTARCKKTVEFLIELYGKEENSGLRVAISHALGKIGTLEAVKGIVTVGAPLLLADPVGVEELGTSLRGPLDPAAEEWLIKNGLSPEIRKDPRGFDIMLKAMSKLKSKNRIPLLLTELKKGSAGVQIAVLEALRPLAEERVAQAAIPLLGSTDVGVQVAAYDVVAALPGAKYRRYFVSGLKSPQWEVRALSVDAIAKLNDKETVKLVAPLLNDKDKRVQISVVQAFLVRGGSDVIEPLFKALDTVDPRVQDDIADALARLTGKNLGPFSAQWESWWIQNKGKAENYKAMSAEAFAKIKEEDKNQAKTVYFGLRVLSNNIGFLFDTSESMDEEYTPKAPTAEKQGDDKDRGKTVVEKPVDKTKGKGKTKKKKVTTKLDIAKKELTSVVKALKDGQNIDIFRFDSRVTDFVAQALDPEKKSLAKLSPQIRPQINAFIQASTAGGLTNLSGVLKAAMEYPNIDTIYLLSDGAPTMGITDHQELLNEVDRLNRRLKIKINTISFDPKPEERRLLQTLSERNFGVYVER